LDQDYLEIKLSEQARSREDVAERFWKKVAKAGPNDCWLWTAGKANHRYGGFRIGRKNLGAHRVAFALTNRLDPDKDVLHKCDVPACCNPAHLYAGTDSDNQQDAYSRGRQVPPRGEQNGQAKLTQAKADEIRRLYAETDLTQWKIARIFGVTAETIWLIVNRKTWV
jgi:HNH endonuclease